MRLHNTLSGNVDPLKTREPGHVRLYVCGPTVYDYAHIGHMRSAIVYDILVRHLRASGQRVTFVRNVTDIDDKIIARAEQKKQSPAELARYFEDAYQADQRTVGNLTPDVEPRVSEHLPEIIALIERLIEGGKAYASQGDVYFDVASFPSYGKLSHRKLDDLELGRSGRLDDQEQQRKRHPADFALWKGAEAGAVSWPSPWGPGRPGWHIECSAMSMRYLGESFDVHGGGLDLVFPHHENEIAQSEAATGKSFCSSWVHHGFVETKAEKMSKSLGNFITAKQCFEVLEPEAMRYLMLTAHYRAPLAIDWQLDDSGKKITAFPALEEAERRVEYLYRTKLRLADIPEARVVPSGPAGADLLAFPEKLAKALEDDLNLPVALAALSDLLKGVNELVERALAKKGQIPLASVEAAKAGLERVGAVLGLGNADAQPLLLRIRARRAARIGVTEADVEAQIKARAQARVDRDFARADAIRNELLSRGIELMDGPEGTSWRIG